MPEPVVFKFSVAVLTIPFAVAGVAFLVAVYLFATGKWYPAAISLLVALVAGLAFGPAMLSDRVVVASDRIEQRAGFPLAPSVKGFRYEDVSFVHIANKRAGPKNRVTMIWEIHSPDGGWRDLNPGDLWEVNNDEIIELLKRRGVEFR